MFLIVRLLGNREDQKKWHLNLRGPLLNLRENGTIMRFVLTYHYKGKDTDNLHLCIDVPDLLDCSMDALMEHQTLEPITKYLKDELSPTQIKIGNYEDEASQEDIDKASRGSAAALRIISEGPKNIGNWKSLVEKIVEYCGPLDAKGNDIAHFCFNSLGLNIQEEALARGVHQNHHILDNMIRRLFNRESWEIDH